jgi:primosomal protein N' (replication factor Y)
LCHYCGFVRPVPETCPVCSGGDFLPAGGGTEKVELSLAGLFPGVRLARLDQDSTRRRGSHGRILAAFAGGEARILIGTQMVAKGHHFPEVGLVGVLAADDGLTLPDFRAAERVFQLLTQVAGRTGRVRSGRVVFQTYQPDNAVIRAAAAQDYRAFFDQELAARRLLGYPPFRRLVRVGLQGRRRAVTEEAARRLARVLQESLHGGEREVLGPAAGVFPRLKDRYRYQVLIKGDLTSAEKEWLGACLRTAQKATSGLDTFLDVDPVGLY